MTLMDEMMVKDGRSLRAAARVIGLGGIREDLNIVRDMCLAADRLLGGNPGNARTMVKAQLTTLQAYYVAAIVTYARCFNGGKRTRLDVHHVRLAAGDQAEAAVALHRNFLAVRDRHVAHSVSAYEEGLLAVVIDGAPSQVHSLAGQVFRLAVTPDAFVGLWSLADLLVPVVETMADRAFASAESEARSLSIEELDALPVAEYVPPGFSAAAGTRGEPKVIPPEGRWGIVLRATEKAGSTDAKTDGLDRRQRVIISGGPSALPQWGDL